MAYPENIADYDAGEYADEGTAAHALAAACLKSKGKVRAASFIGQIIEGGKRTFEVTDEFADHVQTYVDEVERRAIGGYLMVEQRVSLEGIEGFTEANYGTSDAIIAQPGYGTVGDLKFGRGEKVYAWQLAMPGSLFVMQIYGEGDELINVEPNYQLMMYALAALPDLYLLVDNLKYIVIFISQPRLGHLSELQVPVAVLARFALFASEAFAKAELAMGLGVDACIQHDAIATGPQSSKFFNPGEKQCRWCRVVCPARTAKVQQEVAADFDIVGEQPPQVPVKPAAVARALLAVPFVQDWCKAVVAQANALVAGGAELIGPDGQPYKFVEGELGDRKWTDKVAAEAALVGQLGPEKAYTRKLLTAPAAAKIFDKKKTATIWNDLFKPLITRAPGKPILVMGSDPRPPYSPTSDASEFDTEGDE
jgi:hypothetical protein